MLQKCQKMIDLCLSGVFFQALKYAKTCFLPGLHPGPGWGSWLGSLRRSSRPQSRLGRGTPPLHSLPPWCLRHLDLVARSSDPRLVWNLYSPAVKKVGHPCSRGSHRNLLRKCKHPDWMFYIESFDGSVRAQSSDVFSHVVTLLYDALFVASSLQCGAGSHPWQQIVGFAGETSDSANSTTTGFSSLNFCSLLWPYSHNTLYVCAAISSFFF